MIVIDAKCSKGHVFEGWFKDNASFDEQIEAGAVSCPECGDTTISRALMAPNLGGLRKGKEKAPPNAAMSPKDAMMNEYVEALYELKKHVEENSDYVGEKFPEEARKIHYGEEDPRSIHGEATPDEAEELIEEGVEFQRIPWPKPDA